MKTINLFSDDDPSMVAVAFPGGMSCKVQANALAAELSMRGLQGAEGTPQEVAIVAAAFREIAGVSAEAVSDRQAFAAAMAVLREMKSGN